jgi:UDP-N-acetylmuramyl pentapeptide phosphotransferase/UDP-N-acetylglucosamine-1-phosphate transferase
MTDSNVINVVILAAAAVSFVLNRAVLRLFGTLFVATPNGRSDHAAATPQGGGLGILLGAALAIAVAIRTDELLSIRPSTLIAAGVTAAFAIVGAYDDRRPLPALLRLGLQFGLAAIFVSTSPAISLNDPLLAALVWLVCVVSVVGIVNATNFMDGCDLITAAHALPALAGFAAILATTHPDLALLAWAAFGALLGFCVLNWPPAKLFLGDSGSLSIGFLLSVLAVELAVSGHFASAAGLLAYPLLDAGTTLANRIRAGENPFRAHRDHAYQAARDRGMTALRVSGTVLATSMLNAVLLIALIRISPGVLEWLGLAIAISTSAATILFFRSARAAAR